MNSQVITKMLKELRQGSREDKLFYLACLRELGKMMKRLYKLKEDKQLADNIFWLKNHIETYEL